MGDVYAARHREHGRRVALKLLSQDLRGSEDRRRFLQEGEMAAAINHPHCVYVYGSDEIQGVPVIAMELLPGGTLKDRVKERGPLATTEAIDVILQVIAGLDAANQCGVLHRDVKPSNCFVDSDGTVKIGDFGLSIPSTPAPGAVHDALFHGTPGFAAPEQLRGEPLNVRADIFAVGATLYYLLVGDAPGGKPGLSTLAAGVDATPPKPIALFRRDVPKRLAAIIARCLSPRPGGRPSSYAELAAALTPFSSRTVESARLGLRLAARLFDGLILVPVLALTFTSVVGSGVISDPRLAWTLGLVLPLVLYWAIAEGVFGSTIGKRACRLAVVGRDAHTPGIARALVRAVACTTPIVVLVALRLAGASSWASTLTLAVFALAFTMPAVRRRESRLLPDLVSGTRVVRRIAPPEWRQLGVPTPPLPNTGDRRCGPYDIVGTIGATDRGELLLGFDARLRRHVWVHVFGGPPESVPDTPREIRPASRLRWLNGQRSAHTNWDAFEAPTGSSFQAAPVPAPWRSMRRWLLDLIGDLKVSSIESVSLSVGRFWITAEGRLKVLDFSFGGGDGGALDTPMAGLRLVADHALAGTPPTKMPLSAAEFVRRLHTDSTASLSEMEALLTASAETESTVRWRQRGMALAAVALVYLIAGGWIGALVTTAMRAVTPDTWGPSALAVVSASGTALVALACAATWRGGFWLHTFGLAVVTADGQPVSRTRAAGRAAIVWSLVPLAALAGAIGSPLLAVLVTGAQLGIAVHATDHPQRGLHDRWAGTFLVPQ